MHRQGEVLRPPSVSLPAKGEAVPEILKLQAHRVYLGKSSPWGDDVFICAERNPKILAP